MPNGSQLPSQPLVINTHGWIKVRQKGDRFQGFVSAAWRQRRMVPAITDYPCAPQTTVLD